jgi:hypothetical protein
MYEFYPVAGEHEMVTKRKSYRALARQRYRRALWIYGDGPYASLAHCGGLTVLLFGTMEEALQAKALIDRCGCGHACQGDRLSGRHVIEELMN